MKPKRSPFIEAAAIEIGTLFIVPRAPRIQPLATRLAARHKRRRRPRSARPKRTRTRRIVE